MAAQKIVGDGKAAVGAHREQPIAARRPEIGHCVLYSYPPSIAFLRSDCAGLSASQILGGAPLNASPAIDPLAVPFSAILVAPSTKSSVTTSPSLTSPNDFIVATSWSTCGLIAASSSAEVLSFKPSDRASIS